MRTVMLRHAGLALTIPDGWDYFTFEGVLYRVTALGQAVRVR